MRKDKQHKNRNKKQNKNNSHSNNHTNTDQTNNSITTNTNNHKQNYTQYEINEWLAHSHHEPLTPRTTDPKAHRLDLAFQHFFTGVYLARTNKIPEACESLACAYLLDMRSTKIMASDPEPPKEAQHLILDTQLLNTIMMENDPRSISSAVLTVMIGSCIGDNPTNGMIRIERALDAIDGLLAYVEARPDVEREDSGILMGLLKRTTLLITRADFHAGMGNYKKAIKDLTKALKIDRYCTEARFDRASLGASLKLKDVATIHAEFKRILDEVHEDDIRNDESYAWMTITVLADPQLGTMDDAKMYFEKCLRAQMRRDELYVKREKDQMPEVLQVMMDVYKACQEPEALKARKELDAQFHVDRENTMANINANITTSLDEEPSSSNGDSDGDSNDDYDRNLASRKTKDSRNFTGTPSKEQLTRLVAYMALDADRKMAQEGSCVKCGKHKNEIDGELMKCSRCHVATYCSRECQAADWKSHKIYCKLTPDR